MGDGFCVLGEFLVLYIVFNLKELFYVGGVFDFSKLVCVVVVFFGFDGVI